MRDREAAGGRAPGPGAGGGAAPSVQRVLSAALQGPASGLPLQGFVTCTTFTTWVRWFRWDSEAELAGVMDVPKEVRPPGSLGGGGG